MDMMVGVVVVVEAQRENSRMFAVGLYHEPHSSNSNNNNNNNINDNDNDIWNSGNSEDRRF